MANWIDKTVSYFSPRAAAERKRARLMEKIIEHSLRKYDGASHGKRTQGWRASSTSANSENLSALHTLRDRSRDLTRNNPYAASALQTIVVNTIGTGIVCQPKPMRQNNRGEAQRAQRLLELWKSWAESTDCDADGVLDFYGLQSLIMRTTVESGECLVRKRRSRLTDGLTAPVQLQVLEPDFLDTLKSEELSGGRRIVQGIEFDASGRREAYWLFREHPGEVHSFRSIESVRVPASEVIHFFNPLRAGQVRAVSWFAPVMIRMKDFDEYEDAQLVRQKIAACFSAFIEDIEMPLDGSSHIDQLEMIEPGRIETLPPGKRISFANPPGVTGYSEYSRNMLHAIARGLGISYEALTGDLSQVNFSSARLGFLEFQRNIEQWRWNLLIPRLCNPVWAWFLEAADILGFPADGVKATWTPPRREMIDPTREVPATINAIRGGLLTLSEAIREQGFDPKEHLEEMKLDNDRVDELGLILDSDPRKVMRAGTIQHHLAEELKGGAGNE
jgi:lambda family phage portal protein